MADDTSEPTRRLWSAVALAGRTGDLDALAARRDLLAQSDDMRDVVMALELLRATDVASAALSQGLWARGLVGRQAAMTMLVDHLGLADLLAPVWSPLGRLDTALVSPLRSVWEPAATELRHIIEAVGRGESAQDLDLVYRPGVDAAVLESFLASVADRDRPLDVGAMRELTGHDRAWATTHVLARIGFGDLRAIDACAAVPLVEAVPVLLEAVIAHACDATVVEHLDAAFIAVGGPAMLDVPLR